MKNLALAIAMPILLAACANGATTVLQPAESSFKASTINVAAVGDTVGVDPEISNYYGEKLNEYLFADETFTTGNDITVSYRFIQFEEGNRAIRYLVGFGAGKGSLTIESTFTDATGNELAKIQSEGEISVGVLGGSFKEAVAKAARETSDFALANFGKISGS